MSTEESKKPCNLKYSNKKLKVVLTICTKALNLCFVQCLSNLSAYSQVPGLNLRVDRSLLMHESWGIKEIDDLAVQEIVKFLSSYEQKTEAQASMHS
jgi:hypothetical protein